MFLKWLNFKTMDLIWGNGESIWKLIRATFVIVIVMAIVHIFVIKSHSLVDMLKAIGYTPQVFLGVAKPNNYHEGYIAFLIFLRLILFGFFMAILVKRFSKR